NLQNPKDNPFITWPKSRELEAAELEYANGQLTGRAIESYLRQYQGGLYVKQFNDSEELVKDQKRQVSELEKGVFPIEFKGERAGFEAMMVPATDASAGGSMGDRGPGAPGPGRSGRPEPGRGERGDPNAGGRSYLTFWPKENTKVPTLEEA